MSIKVGVVFYQYDTSISDVQIPLYNCRIDTGEIWPRKQPASQVPLSNWRKNSVPSTPITDLGREKFSWSGFHRKQVNSFLKGSYSLPWIHESWSLFLIIIFCIRDHSLPQLVTASTGTHGTWRSGAVSPLPFLGCGGGKKGGNCSCTTAHPSGTLPEGVVGFASSYGASEKMLSAKTC